MEQVVWARELARQLLADPLPRRWAHTQGVGEKAESIAHIVDLEADLLSCAAWLHDIGYSPALAVTGFHPLDGARYLRGVVDADRLCRLVANHSGAMVEARVRGLDEQLAAEFPAVDGLLAHALTYCDVTTSPDGEPVGVDTRLAEIVARYGDGEPVAVSIKEASVQLRESVRVISALVG